MPRKTKNKKQEREPETKNKISDGRIMQILVVIIAILLLIIVFLFLINTGENEKNNIPDRNWLVENCKCVEYNGTRSCPVGFELNNESTICRNIKQKAYTSVLIACSKYKCPEYFVDLNKTYEE